MNRYTQCKNNTKCYCRVPLPIVRITPPSTGGRPHVLWIIKLFYTSLFDRVITVNYETFKVLNVSQKLTISLKKSYKIIPLLIERPSLASFILCNQALSCFPLMHCGCRRMPLLRKNFQTWRRYRNW